MGPVLSLALQTQGQILLHAGCVEIDGTALAFAGPRGTGKSTLANQFDAAGFTVLSDDTLPVRWCDGTVVATQGLPWMKLRADSLASVGGSTDGFEEVMPGRGKFRVPYRRRLQPVVVPLETLYLLQPASRATPLARRLTGIDAVIAILSSNWSSQTLVRARARMALEGAADLAGAMAVFAVEYERSFEGLPILREFLVRHHLEVAGGR